MLACFFLTGCYDRQVAGYGTFFIRVTGGDVEQQKTLRFDLDKQTVEVEDRARRRA
jgi:hypothetical protein